VQDYDLSTYGDRIAGEYDEWVAGLVETESAVALLADLARGGPALELGIGTGRIAVPLAQRGIPVHGIDASAAMVGKLRAKAGGADIPVTIGNFAEVAVRGHFALIYVVFNTFFGLLSQDDQVLCFRNVAEHLAQDAVFVLEAFVPDPTLFNRGQRMGIRHLQTGRLVLDASQHDPVNQRVTSQHVVIQETGVKLYPVQIRYAWPSELDLMARLAGLRLQDRWGGWRREPFTAASATHVSVYALA
jgi:SAM-dependent methyltransferase